MAGGVLLSLLVIGSEEKSQTSECAELGESRAAPAVFAAAGSHSQQQVPGGLVSSVGFLFSNLACAEKHQRSARGWLALLFLQRG